MGTAVAYDEWNDAGQAFSESEIAGFQVASVAEARVKWLLHNVEVIVRYLEIPGAAKNQWWGRLKDRMVDRVTWYCKVAVLPGIDRAVVFDIPGSETVAGKALTVEAQHLDAAAFIAAWRNELVVEMRLFVTLCRACKAAGKVSGWNKTSQSMGNKVANALLMELHLIDSVSEALTSLTA